MHTIYQVDGQGKDSYEVANGSVATYWYGHAFELNGTRYFTGFTWDTRERYGKPGEDDAGPDPGQPGRSHLHADRLHARQALAVRGMTNTIGNFGAYEKPEFVDPKRKHAAGQLVLALPTDGFDNGTSFTGYALFVFNPGPRDELKDKVWTYVGSVNTGSDNSAACADGDVMPCVSSQGELSFAAHGGSDMPRISVKVSGTTITGPGKTRQLGAADTVTYHYDAAGKKYASQAASPARSFSTAPDDTQDGMRITQDAHPVVASTPSKRRATVGRPSCCGAEHEPPDPGFRPVAYCLAGHALPDRHHGTVPVGRPALLSNTRQLCDAARHAGVAVYFAKIHFSPGYPEVSP